MVPMKMFSNCRSSNRNDIRVSRFGLDGVLVANGSEFNTLHVGSLESKIDTEQKGASLLYTLVQLCCFVVVMIFPIPNHIYPHTPSPFPKLQI
jgi:hypothetical protein